MDINYHRNNFFLYPKELMKNRLLDEGWWGGWQSAQWDVCPADFYSYISSTWVPKLAPLVRLSVDGQLIVAGHPVYNTYSGFFRTLWGGVKSTVSAVCDDIHHLASNNDRNPHKHQPVFNSKKEDWVEKLMWDMGMARSNYKPEVKDLFPHMNVGTVGHIDYANAAFRQYIGRTTYVPPKGDEIIESIRDLINRPEHRHFEPIGPQTIEEYQAHLRAWDPAKQEPTLAGLFFGIRK